MSGLAGVRWLDMTRRASSHDIDAVLATLAHRGPDGLHRRASGVCALGIAHHISTPEARTERQPHLTTSGLVVTLDGRIDNADELRESLRLSQDDAHSDVAIVAAAWSRWGAETPVRLLGDFALAVWDARRRVLCLARDIFGLRPLCYRTHAGGFWWASEVQSLARLGDARVNAGMAVEYLTDALRSETETLVEGVVRVPRASVLILEPNGTKHLRRYWTPRVPTAARRSDGEVVEEFRDVFGAAVRARVRSDRPIGITLSGGLDSSLIAAEAARLAQRHEAPDVSTFTLRLPGHPADESPFAVAVAQHLHLRSTLSDFGRASLAPIVADAALALDMPMATNCIAGMAMSDALRDSGTRVCLTGIGGNEWFSGYHFPFADHIRRLQVGQLIKRMAAYRRDDPAYTPYRDLRLAMWLQLPETLKDRVRALWAGHAPAWIQPAFAARVGLGERMRARVPLVDLPTTQQQLMFAWATNPDKMFFTEYTERVNAVLGCEERMPFLDRRVVEWALTLPEDQRWREGVEKVVLRHVARTVLPPSIAARGRGPDFSFQTADGLREIGGRELIMSIAHIRGDWVRPEAVSQLWNDMLEAERPGGRRLGYYSWLLWLLVGTHLAAQAIEQCRPIRLGSTLTMPQETVA